MHPDQVGRLHVGFDDHRIAITGRRLDGGAEHDSFCRLYLLRSQREPDGEARAFALLAFHSQGAAVKLREQLDHGEAEASALVLSR